MKINIVYTIGVVITVLVGCGTTKFYVWQDNQTYKGQGGALETIDEIEFWLKGMPNREFKIVGYIEHSHPTGGINGLVNNLSYKKSISKVAKSHDGEAIIFVENYKEISGYKYNTSINTVGNSSYATTSGRPAYHQNANILVIKYVTELDNKYSQLSNSEGIYKIVYPKDKWKIIEPNFNPEADFTLKLVKSDTHVTIIHEFAQFPEDKLFSFVVNRFEKQANNVKVLSNKPITINGLNCYNITLEGGMEGIKLVQHGYFAIGEFGTIQLLFICYENKLDAELAALEEFASGLYITDKNSR